MILFRYKLPLVIACTIILLYVAFLPSERQQNGNSNLMKTGHFCKPIKDRHSIATYKQKDSWSSDATMICITHGKRRCFKKSSYPKMAEIAPDFIEKHPEVFCSELVSVGKGDENGLGPGQYPYQLCKDWLPDPTNCIVYSVGYVKSMVFCSIT